MSDTVRRVAYKPVGLLIGVTAGAVSGMLFNQAWKQLSHDGEVPAATDERRGWGEVLVAATLQGAIFAVVRAAIDRAGATGVRKATGHWPA